MAGAPVVPPKAEPKGNAAAKVRALRPPKPLNDDTEGVTVYDKEFWARVRERALALRVDRAAKERLAEELAAENPAPPIDSRNSPMA